MGKKLLLFLIPLLIFGFFAAQEAKAGASDNVSGWAYSENIGWISFNNTTGGGATNYGVNINASTGVFSGYAWSRGTDADIGGVGWITFNESDLVGCPSGTCQAKLDFGTRQVSGWAKALNGASWIKLRGTAQDGNPYGVSWNSSTKEMEGWAWSDTSIGGISFNCKDGGYNEGTGSLYDVCGTSNYKVIFNPLPTAINLSVDSHNPADYCGVTSYPPVRVRWQFSDPGGSQSAYQVQADNNSNFLSPELDTGKINSGSQSFLIAPPYSTLSWDTTYYWRLKVWDSQDAASLDWIVGPSFTTASHAYPYVDFTVSPLRVNIGEWVYFTDNSKCYRTPNNNEYSCKTEAVTSYAWDFQTDSVIDSTTRGNEKTTYPTSGTYTVTLKITDDLGVCSTNRQVNVRAPLPKYKEVPPL